MTDPEKTELNNEKSADALMNSDQDHVIVKPKKTRRWKRLSRCEIGLMALLLIVVCILILMVVLYALKPSVDVCITDTCIAVSHQLKSGMNLEADPCDDFFEFACGRWNREHPIPDEKSSYNIFEKMADDLVLKLRVLLESKKSTLEGKAIANAKVLYESCKDIAQIEDEGSAAFMKILKAFGGWPVKRSLGEFKIETHLGQMRRDYNLGILIESSVGADDKNSTVNIMQMDQAELGLPARDYYLPGASAYDNKTLNGYRQFIANVSRVMGIGKSIGERLANDVLKLETQVANFMNSMEQRSDPSKRYRKLMLRDLQREMPGFNWALYLETVLGFRLNDTEQIVILANDYFKGLAMFLTSADKETMLNYINWRLILTVLPDLTSKFKIVYKEYRRVLYGVVKEEKRTKQCVNYVNMHMGMALSAMFVDRHFEKDSKATALEMIHDIRDAFYEVLDENPWMIEKTRKLAREKAEAVGWKIGFPDFILNMTALDTIYVDFAFKTSTYFENILKLTKFHSHKQLSKLRKAVDKTEWLQSPAIVNAFYDPNKNEMVFPAGILQPMFYSRHFPKSLNYGGVGVVIGHEITHGFDDNGRQFDKNGNLLQWWENETIIEFRKQAQCMIDQYSKYVVKSVNKSVNGRMTQGENVADNGGLKEAYRAYRKWVSTHGEEQPLPGIRLSHDQMFFLNFAQIWCGTQRKKSALLTVTESVHAPAQFRVLGTLSNSMDFAKVYQCPSGSKMNPVKKCSVW